MKTVHSAERLIRSTSRTVPSACSSVPATAEPLSKRLLRQGRKAGPSQGGTVNLSAMLPDYYDKRGWDQNGAPTQNK